MPEVTTQQVTDMMWDVFVEGFFIGEVFRVVGNRERYYGVLSNADDETATMFSVDDAADELYLLNIS